MQLVVRTVILFCLGLPLAAGLIGIILPAFGYFPVIGSVEFSIQPFFELFDYPGFFTALKLSFCTGLLACFLSYLFAMLFLVFVFGQNGNSWLLRLVSPLLSVPHVTVAIGLMFLLQPSGWGMRLISPELTGWLRPPNLNIVPDEYGGMLVFGLIAKEMPFFVLMGLSALSQIRSNMLLSTAHVHGYSRMAGWFLVIHPILAKHLRLAVVIVLVFSMSVIDMAIILAPDTPPPLSVLILNFFQDPDLKMRHLGAAASLVLIAAICIAALIWMGCSYGLFGAIKYIVRRGIRLSWLGSSNRLHSWSSVSHVGLFLIILPLCASFLGLCSALIWAFAEVWRFPDFLPQHWGVGGWTINADLFIQAGLNSVYLGLLASTISLAAAILWLETGSAEKKAGYGEKLVYLPLILPQTSFLFGLQLLLISLYLDGSFIAILWAHCLFVFPYIMLSLAEQWRRFDRRLEENAAVLGQNRWRRLFTVKLPCLGVPIGISFAIGFAVSAALYLPTIFAGHGRFITLTTEAVILASGAGRQALGAAAFMQMLLPLIVFVGIENLLRFRYRHFSAFKF